MICINCFHEKTTVVNSRQHKTQVAIWRRRSCAQCGHIFTTYEHPAAEAVSIRDEQGNSTPFNIGKLVISIGNCFQHDKNIADRYSYDLAITVREKIMHLTTPSINDIAATTHSVLQRFDQIAAVQYAAQHNLIVSGRRRRGRPAFSYRGESDRSLSR